MSIMMQGSWIIRVKSKDSVFPQQFIINGATSGNGIYSGAVSTSDVYVEGASWTISIMNNSGVGFVPSEMQIKAPVVKAGMYCMDIESEDAGDKDFNDLILTCLTPVTDQDFILYGHLSYYDERCLFNPCYPRFIKIDNWKSLIQALKLKGIKEIIEKLYPELIWRFPFPPDPEPWNFKPILIPLDEENIPLKSIQKITSTSEVLEIGDKKTKRSINYNSPKNITIENVPFSKNIERYNIDTKYLNSIVDKLRPHCETGPMAFTPIKFQEYDRTSNELAGLPYSGAGNREFLGQTVTDRNGNYIVRFKRSVQQFLEESVYDTATGENAVIQGMPDVVVQVLDNTDYTKVLYESAPFWNISLKRRINLCVPKSMAGNIYHACNGQSIIQKVGNIIVGPYEPTTGRRETIYNVLTNNGLISARDSHGPEIRCGAWTGTLQIWGCLKNRDIKYYTVRYKKPSETNWNFINDDLTLPKYAEIFGINTVIYPKVGKEFHDLKINGNSNPAVSAPAYLNVETDSDPDWMDAMKPLKAKINSYGITSTPGPVQIRIEGYKANGEKLVDVDESITLYIDNTWVDALINPNVTMNGVTLGNCALFTLPAGENNTPIKVKFKAVQNSGFMNNYELYMNKGATGYFNLDPATVYAEFPDLYSVFMNNVENRGRIYHHHSDVNCNLRFKGTISELSSDADGYYEVTLRPQSGGWLTEDQTFCAFGIYLKGSVRHTDGINSNYEFWGNQVLIGIQK